MPPVVPTPTVPINFVHATAGEIIHLGPVKLRVMEDGSRTGTSSPLIALSDISSEFHISFHLPSLYTLRASIHYRLPCLPSGPSYVISAGKAVKVNIVLTILEDNRISAVELIIPPKTPGPPAHWHEMHDETFLVTKGTVRFQYVYIINKPSLLHPLSSQFLRSLFMCTFPASVLSLYSPDIPLREWKQSQLISVLASLKLQA